MKRIYVAGPYSADNVLGVLNNIREGMRWSTRLMLDGFAPFCPWLDFHYQLMLREGEQLTVDQYYAYSLAWLRVSDAMFVIPNWTQSKGTQKEILVATELRIPVFFEYDKGWMSAILSKQKTCQNTTAEAK